ncbi:periplasmic beta-glucosidase precursor, putative [Talaromyces stipitatus ATCC 10500]|uniref:beta-glucosidase n=1 Tax=Talaromyces stipitatus (strain ATCC 10500 / CBS 375.48 / QM 6759 / NRRL 1006) TaxID=441959 RepID=B8MCW0_TALSN|nr:periplasmic beta-glucosidase precursor, putative [Talaromyces stipitatus ATCC 10500]EED17486.1 periplasmic beta-glucosidase precursor, putative [Talaromyces stipitatus ATCC 10500]
MGVRWVLSPELDVGREPRYGRVGEMYGEDQYLNGVFGTSYVKTMEEKDEKGYMKVATTIKHFVYGVPTGGINTASQSGGLNHLFNDLVAPFATVIKEAQPASVMISYASIDCEPMSVNKFMMQTVLRQKLDFDGVFMSDALAILHLHTQSKVAKSLEDAALRALKAGLQLELSPAQPAAFPTLVSSTNIAWVRERIDDAVLRILKIKFQTGLFDEELPQIADAQATLRLEAHLAINRNMSRESIVLLQNDGILPLTKNKNGTWPKTAIIGPFANIINPGSYAPNNSTDRSFGKSLYQSMVSAFSFDRVSFTQGADIIGNDTSGIKAAVQAAKEAGLAVLMLGSLSVITADPLFNERRDGEFFTHADLGFPGRQQDLLDAILATGVPTVVILSGGQAFVLNDHTLQSNAILHSFLGGEYTTDALVEILTGEVNPSGKLTISMPQSSSTIPVYYNYLPSDNQGGVAGIAPGNFTTAWQFPSLPTPPTMAFGYGLSYTTFKYSNAQISSGESINLTVDITNTGNMTGKEVVQLYFRPEFSVIETPVKKLIRFEKIELAPGETVTVDFTVPTWDLGYYRHMAWEVETGAYSFWVGSSSRDHDLIYLNATVV